MLDPQPCLVGLKRFLMVGNTHNKRLKHRGLRPLDSQQVARRLGDSYV
jgi:hypothetical protein